MTTHTDFENELSQKFYLQAGMNKTTVELWKNFPLSSMTPEELAKSLRNIGPTVAKKLINAGIDTPAKLKKLGAKKAFLRIHQTGGFCGKFHAAYLYALEGAIIDCDWREIPEEIKKDFKAFTEKLRNS